MSEPIRKSAAMVPPASAQRSLRLSGKSATSPSGWIAASWWRWAAPRKSPRRTWRTI